MGQWGRLADRVGLFVRQQLQARGHEVTVFDPKVHQLPLLVKAYHHYQPGGGETRPAVLEEMGAAVRAADGYVVVSAEYNHSIPPALSNMLDHFGASMYSYKPSAICTYSPGPWGGRHCAIQLRTILSELGCLPVSNIFSVPDARNAINEKGECEERVLARFAKMLGQLEWHAHAMRAHREKVGTPK